MLSAALVCALLAPPPPVTAPQDPAPARILFDGYPWRPSRDGSDHIPLAGHADSPSPGDPIRVGEHCEYWLTLAAGDEVRFVEPAEPVGHLFVETSAGRDLVAVDGPALLGLDPAARSSLRGVCLSRWDDAVGLALVDLDPDAVVRIGSGCAVGDARRFPPLPPTLRRLVVEFDSRQGFDDWSAAARLTELRVLVVGGNHKGFDSVELEAFAGATELRALDILQPDVAGARAVAGFRSLRVLRWEDPPLDDLEPLRAMTELRVLRLHEGQHRSLAPLADLPHLRDLDTGFSPVDDLPPTGFPALRSLDLQATVISLAALRAFRRHHPDCAVRARPDPDQLRTALATADRLVVREGGTCHLRGDERVLAEVTDAATIRDVAAWLDIDPARHGFGCMCCGSPTLIFHAGDRVVATVGIHHGRSIRWADGPWTSDALLDEAGAAPLTAWLATVGATGPKQELDEARARRASALARLRMRRALVGEAALEALEDDAARVLGNGALTGIDALRLLGCHDGAWNELDALDRALQDALRTRSDDLDGDAVAAAAASDPRVVRGLAALLFVPTTDAPPLAARVAPLLRAAAAAGLRHPQPFNRARTVQVLRDLDGDIARDLLREALAGAFEPREVPADALATPGGMTVVMPSDPILDRKGCSTPTLAGLALIARRDAASFAAIRAWAERAPERDRPALLRALDDR